MKSEVIPRLPIALLLLPLAVNSLGCSAEERRQAENRVIDLDLVIAGGRVIDPETELDGIRHVGIKDGVIVAVSETSLDDRLAAEGTRIDAAGLVVSPGFIDLHAHGQSATSNIYQAHDGVTTALELEWGYLGLRDWLQSREGKAPINYGAAAAQGYARGLALLTPEERSALEEKIRSSAQSDEGVLYAIQEVTSSTFYMPLPEDKYQIMRQELEEGLSEGGIGIGMAHQYTPGANRSEVFEVFRIAADLDVPIFTHVRSMGLDAMQEVVANATATGAPLHIVHVNSMSLGQIERVLELIRGARDRGIDITTEAYPYTAASTGIASSIFDPGWQEALGISYDAVQWEATGERLTKETFDQYRKTGGTVIVHMMKEGWIEEAMSTPFVMVASDGMPYAPGAHPRSAGTFSRVLGRYVRERGVLDLPLAIRKMTLMPAQRLAEIAPAMRKKGRIQVGMDADITIFDPLSVSDTATFEDDLSFSKGIEHVLVRGVSVVSEGETVEGVFPGQAILGRYVEQ